MHEPDHNLLLGISFPIRILNHSNASNILTIRNDTPFSYLTTRITIRFSPNLGSNIAPSLLPTPFTDHPLPPLHTKHFFPHLHHVYLITLIPTGTRLSNLVLGAAFRADPALVAVDGTHFVLVVGCWVGEKVVAVMMS